MICLHHFYQPVLINVETPQYITLYKYVISVHCRGIAIFNLLS